MAWERWHERVREIDAIYNGSWTMEWPRLSWRRRVLFRLRRLVGRR